MQTHRLHANLPKLQTIMMQPDSSIASTSAESVDDYCFNRDATSTPATSPMISLQHDSVLETMDNLTNIGLATGSTLNRIKQQLPDILDPATAAGIEVKNVCFVGAGYVGRF
jgi:UDPglucose 6-dehydrogenase